MKKAIVIGASGLIGSNLIDVLLSDSGIQEVIALVRKPLKTKHKKLIQHIVDFEDEESFSKFIYGDAIFCCLGTTKSKSPDPNVYRKVDYEYPLVIAQIASRNFVRQFHIVSALGADSQSVAFYNRLKGELEDALRLLDLRSLCIYQPSLLDGSREESRPIEKAAIAFMWFLNPILLGPLRKYRSIKAITVATAMVITAKKNLDGVSIYPSDKIKEII